jgi:hypothetical protein
MFPGATALRVRPGLVVVVDRLPAARLDSWFNHWHEKAHRSSLPTKGDQ